MTTVTVAVPLVVRLAAGMVALRCVASVTTTVTGAAPGAWVAAVLDINSRGLLTWLRFRRGKWKAIKV